MKNKKFITLIFLLSFPVAIFANTIFETGFLPIATSMPISMHRWQLIQHATTRSLYQLNTLIPQQQTIDNWRQMITMMTMRPSKQNSDKNVEQLMDIVLSSVKNKCLVVNSKVISKSDNDITFTYTMQRCGTLASLDQFVVMRLIKGKHGIHSIDYAVRTPHVSKQQKATMLQLIAATKLVQASG